MASELLRESGVPTYNVKHIQLRRNGQLLGLYGLVQEVSRRRPARCGAPGFSISPPLHPLLQVDEQFLRQWGLPDSSQGGLLYKSGSGDLSNLRYDIPAVDLKDFWGESSPVIGWPCCLQSLPALWRSKGPFSIPLFSPYRDEAGNRGD